MGIVRTEARGDLDLIGQLYLVLRVKAVQVHIKYRCGIGKDVIPGVVDIIVAAAHAVRPVADIILDAQVIHAAVPAVHKTVIDVVEFVVRAEQESVFPLLQVKLSLISSVR